MQIKECYIAAKRRIGTLHKQPVVEMLLKGGLYIITTLKDGKPVSVGLGPHRGVARYLAQKNEPDIQIEELSKTEEISLPGILSVEKEYQDLRDRWNSMLAGVVE